MRTFLRELELELCFRAPLRPDNLFGHLAATMVPGVEEIRDGFYRRTLRLPGGPGVVALAPREDHVDCRLLLSRAADERAAVAQSRWLLDLDADPAEIDRALARDPQLAPLVRAAPGRRVPRCVDGAEMAVRAVLGQQISTAAARTHAGRLAAAYGEPVDDPSGELTRLFPLPGALREASLAMPASRIRTLRALACALEDETVSLRALTELPGVGEWTAAIVAMRGLGDPDAFPASDLGVRRGAAALGLPSAPAHLLRHAEAWRPWRAYAVQHLWALNDHPINHWPPAGR
ncbi:MAG TPA: AlkA N-terminal domain-containing protein [Solirubrobacteraceae bacterium]|nr:AlkA N-terminal domain-containing protein [Solirubrobacteraceae bacterium]